MNWSVMGRSGTVDNQSTRNRANAGRRSSRKQSCSSISRQAFPRRDVNAEVV